MNLNQVTLPATDVEQSIVFYKTLGLKLIVHVPETYARFLCPSGETTFSIHKVDNLKNPSPWLSVYFEVEQLAKTVKQLKEKGIIFETEIMEQPWLWNEIYVKDPSKNQIIIYHAGEHRKNPPWRIK